MAEYLSLRCTNPWCGQKFLRPVLRRKSTRACPNCGRTVKATDTSAQAGAVIFDAHAAPDMTSCSERAGR